MHNETIFLFFVKGVMVQETEGKHLQKILLQCFLGKFQFVIFDDDKICYTPCDPLAEIISRCVVKPALIYFCPVN